MAIRLGGHRWRLLKAAYLEKHEVCEDCERAEHRRAVIVTHRQPPGNDEELFYRWQNLIALCRPCAERRRRVPTS
jgi:hypothetical protein